MKKIYVLWSLALMTIMANVFFACKSDDTIEDFYRQHGFTLNTAKNPDFVIYSNGNVLSTTLGTRSEFGTRGEGTSAYAYREGWGNGDFAQYSTNPPASITNASYILSAIPSASETTTDATNYFVQWVGCDKNYLGLTNISFNGIIPNSTNQYYWNDILIINTPLTNVTVQKNGTTISKYKLFSIDGGIYLGIDGDDDNVYNDWVFKITPATANSSGTGTVQGLTLGENCFKVVDGITNVKNKYPDKADEWWAKAPKTTDRDENVSQAEYEAVMAYLQANPNQGGTECNVTTYFIQNVGGSYEKYGKMIDWNHVEHNDVVGSEHMDKVIWGGCHIFDYNAVGGKRELLIDFPITDPTYYESWGDKLNTVHDAYRFYEIEYDGETNLYLCFDYQTEKYSEEEHSGNGVYDDWVIKIIPLESSTEPVVTPVPNEVEVNLSVNDEKEEGDYIATKLSIHIRAWTDVEVFIPVKQEYYCDVDDMAIVLSHKMDPAYQYSNPGVASISNGFTYSYTVAGEYVKDGETLTANEKIYVTVTYEPNGIRVKTSGMTQAALDYLNYKYQDGLTVEVWNYFNSEIPNPENTKETLPVTRADLKPMLDESTVTFTKDPEYYVNAFAMLYDYQKADGDIRVYMKNNKPYLVKDGVETDELLDTKYWVADANGNFVKFVGEKNAWDCTVTPTDKAWLVSETHNGTDPADYNVVYTK